MEFQCVKGRPWKHFSQILRHGGYRKKKKKEKKQSQTIDINIEIGSLFRDMKL